MNRTIEIHKIFGDCGTDKKDHYYAPVYAEVPRDIKTILEIGVLHGQSLKAWLYAFPQAEIYGVDNWQQENRPWANPVVDERVHFLNYSFRDLPLALLPKFDLIIDDATHIHSDILDAYNILKDKLKPGGRYVIEDVQFAEVGKIYDGGIPKNAELWILGNDRTDPSNHRIITWENW